MFVYQRVDGLHPKNGTKKHIPMPLLMTLGSIVSCHLGAANVGSDIKHVHLWSWILTHIQLTFGKYTDMLSPFPTVA